MGANDPWGGAIFDPRDKVGRINKEDHYTLLRTKYESSRPRVAIHIYFVFKSLK